MEDAADKNKDVKVFRPPETAPSSEMQRIQRGKKNEKIVKMKGMLSVLEIAEKNRSQNTQNQLLGKQNQEQSVE